MCAHLFGNTSSLSCSSYALKMNSVDHQIKITEDAIKLFKRLLMLTIC